MEDITLWIIRINGLSPPLTHLCLSFLLLGGETTTVYPLPCTFQIDMEDSSPLWDANVRAGRGCTPWMKATGNWNSTLPMVAGTIAAKTFAHQERLYWSIMVLGNDFVDIHIWTQLAAQKCYYNPEPARIQRIPRCVLVPPGVLQTSLSSYWLVKWWSLLSLTVPNDWRIPLQHKLIDHHQLPITSCPVVINTKEPVPIFHPGLGLWSQ